MPTTFALTVAILLQTPAQSQTPAPAAQPTATVPPPPAQAAYVYQVEGRRDPFVSLIGRGADGKSGDARLTGLPGLQISEVMLKGILKDRSGFFALLQGPDNKTYQVRSGDKLLDGSVKSINGVLQAVAVGLKHHPEPVERDEPRLLFCEVASGQVRHCPQPSGAVPKIRSRAGFGRKRK